MIYEEHALSEIINTGFCQNNCKDCKLNGIIDCLNHEFLLGAMSY